MGIWTLIQLKLSQIEHLVLYNENQKSKYIENSIQEIVINKLNVLKNDKLISNFNRYKTLTSDHVI